MGVSHLKEYHKSDAEGTEVSLEPTGKPVETSIKYPALVKVVELYVDGRMHQGDASTLSKGGWMFNITSEERVRAVAQALRVR